MDIREFPPLEAYETEVLEFCEPLHPTASHVTTDRTSRAPRILWGNEIDAAVDVNWLIKGVLERGQIFAIYGSPKTGKTFAALDLAMHIARGHDWFGHKVKAPGVVIYVAAEGVEAVKRRIRAHAVRHGVGHADLGRVAILSGSVNLVQEELANELIHAVRTAVRHAGQDIAVIIFDTLARVTAGADENSATDMSMAVATCDRLRDEFGCAVGIVHHAGKDTSRGMRGSNALLAGVDLVLSVTRDAETKVSKIVAEAQREGDGSFSATFELENVTLGQDDDGDPVTSCVVVRSAAPDGPGTGRRQLSPTVCRELQILADVVARYGRPLPSPDPQVPTNAVVVTEDQWRQSHYARSPSDTQDARQKAFKRGETLLLRLGLAGKWNAWIWLVNPDTRTGADNSPDMSGP